MTGPRLQSMDEAKEKAAPDLSALRIRREPEKSRGPRGWMLLGALLVVGAGAGAYFYSGKSLRPNKVEAVTASVVTEGQATTVLTATGYVEAERKADLSPKITSRITELNVTEGSRVNRGDVIARLDHTDLDAQMAEARASWVNAKAELDRQQRAPGPGTDPEGLARCGRLAGGRDAGARELRQGASRLHGDPRALHGCHHGQAGARRRGRLAVRILPLGRRVGRRDRDARRVFESCTSARTSTSRTSASWRPTSRRRSHWTPCRTRPTTGACARSCLRRTARRRPCGSRSPSLTPTRRSCRTFRRASRSRPKPRRGRQPVAGPRSAHGGGEHATARPGSSGSPRGARCSCRSRTGGEVQGQVEVESGLQGGERLDLFAGRTSAKAGTGSGRGGEE